MTHTIRKGFLAGFTLLIFGVLFFTACKKKVEPVPNRAPEPFQVEVTLEEDGTTVNLNWSKAIDPDDDVVSYTVVLGDTLAKSLTDTTFRITDLGYDYIKDGKVIANDSAGLSSEVTFSVSTSENPFLAIPDVNFEKYLVDNKIDKDGKVNGKMAIEDTKGVTKIDCNSLGISSLEGIERFTDLQELYCFDNRLTSLDVNSNLNLKELSCDSTYLTSLDVSNNVNLEVLRCSVNSLTSLDVSKNLNLEELFFPYNSLTSLDVSKNVNLKALYSSGNSLSSLDVSNNVNLEILNCSVNSLTSLDVSRNVNLKILGCGVNFLTSLDLSKNLNLENLFCIFNSLTNLDLSKNGNLRYLSSRNNSELSTICVSDVAKAKAEEYWYKDETAEYKVCD
ncbi:leucine-rich repeat domain-containing protein [Arcticibacterium luteifluviistationis]|uniref:Fibronectin type-III domain-containing protein n=1 Tax=Arcticibacterium luteifluviistationis TaxID=1784714 RepID=A0A2Z4GEW8_9BACT|nr:hypothetical protein [Arcticibacterium luteifluviistationis]AWV99899.1 hypothetical protein DJ013_17670 [Arcticibacterium luteifluviistationis]